ncbi:type VII secretion protein EssA [Jeotgalibacillus sp. S-D1]|uniref:type VII secretion protein EssA n=1 Tax=Jeotgalibacillus sp. S-D1 TaxID=2552189 RepID=UPI001059733D|nr:type VII secretion protein EssA [Jeotgalibacillus sp. S-D1]TDL31374.1 type VII secretion protein EssA [Jeotgalibacillus sp. S-D1]
MKQLKRAAVACFLFSLSLGIVLPALAASASVVQPNLYEEKKVDLNTDYFHEDSLLDRREGLSDQIQSLTFDGSKITSFDQLREELFLSPVKETNTITSRAQELGLFTDENKTSVPYSYSGQETKSEWNVMIVVFAIIVAAAAGAMLFLLVKYSANGAKKTSA